MTRFSFPSKHSGDSVGTAGLKSGDSVGTAARERWPGGYVRGGVFVIERRIRGVKFHFSTHATTLRAAMKQLERFEMDPHGYKPEGEVEPDALVMTEQLIDEFHEWHLLKVSRPWALNVRCLLIDWSNDLRGADLRHLDLLEDLKPHLKRHPRQAHHRAKSLKVFFTWLRQERGLVTRAQDATLDLPIPVLKPAQDSGHRKAVPWKVVVAAAQHLPQRTRDVLELLAATGWHVNEVRRFAVDGTIRERNAADAPEVVAMLGTRHKSGRVHFTAVVHEQHLEVAKRIRAVGHVIDNGALRKHLKKACAKAGVDYFAMGQLRHSVATWLTQAGVAVADTSRFLGHQSATTTRRHYIDSQTAALVLPRAALRVVGAA